MREKIRWSKKDEVPSKVSVMISMEKKAYLFSPHYNNIQANTWESKFIPLNYEVICTFTYSYCNSSPYSGFKAIEIRQTKV